MKEKTVKIRRKMTGTSQQPKEIRENAKVKLSNVYSGGRPIHAFDPNSEAEELKKIMPKVIDADPNDSRFYDKVSKWNVELSVNIPHEGKSLNISTYEDGTPVVPRDYCIYKFALNHPLVAKNEEEAKTYRMMKYWIEDPKEVLDKQTNKTETKAQAWTEFIEIKENEDKLNHMLRVFAGLQPERIGTKEEKVNELSSRMENDPEEFIKVANNKDLELEDFVLQLIENNVLRKIGNQIMFNDEVLGDTMDEVVAFLKNKRHSSTLSTLKAKLKEAKR